MRGIREQLRALARILEQADPVVFHHLRQIGAGECFFAYRMVIVQLRRELSLYSCPWPRQASLC